MRRIGRKDILSLHISNIFHNLVFTFPGNFMSRKDYLDSLPGGILLDLLANKVFQLIGEPFHKFCARSNTIRIKGIFFGNFFSRSFRFLDGISHITSSSKSTRTLLIHFRTRSNSINCHVKHLSRLDNMKEPVNRIKHERKHLFFTNSVEVIIIRMRTCMDDTIHI